MKFESDRDLKQAFDALRAADAQRAPSFARTLAERRSARRPRVLIPVFAAVTLLALVATWRLTREPDTPFVIRAGDLRVPTDYLLDLASYPRAGEIPNIGSVDWFPLTDRAQNTETRREQ